MSKSEKSISRSVKNEKLILSSTKNFKDLKKVSSMRQVADKFTFPTNESHLNLPEDLSNLKSRSIVNKFDVSNSLGPYCFGQTFNCANKQKESEKAIRVNHNVFGQDNNSYNNELSNIRSPDKSLNFGYTTYNSPKFAINVFSPKNHAVDFETKRKLSEDVKSNNKMSKSSLDKNSSWRVNQPEIKNIPMSLTNIDNKPSKKSSMSAERKKTKSLSTNSRNLKLTKSTVQNSEINLSNTGNNKNVLDIFSFKKPSQKSMQYIKNTTDQLKNSDKLHDRKFNIPKSKNAIKKRMSCLDGSSHTRLIVSNNASKAFEKNYDLDNASNQSENFYDEQDFINVEEFDKKNPIFSSISANTKGGQSNDMTKENQDSYFAQIGVDKDIKCERILLGVFDGHGNHGEKISQFVKKNFQETLIDHADIKATMNDRANFDYKHEISVQRLQNDTYIRVNNSINDSCSKYANSSGSTGVTAFVIDNKVYCANIGDSECGLVVSSDMFGRYTMKMQSKNHLPSNPVEKERIENNGGIIEPYRQHSGQFCGPLRIWKKGTNGPGLMMTRSFGDGEGHNIGMSNIPDICIEKLKPCYVALIQASDGIWEILNRKQVAEIVGKHSQNSDSKAAVKELMATASALWITKNQDAEYRDDITVIVAYFK